MRGFPFVALLATASIASRGAHAQAPSPVATPFAFADFRWVPGNGRTSESPIVAGPLTGEIRIDTAWHDELSHPVDDTISGSSEVFRSGETQLTQIGFGGDVFYKNAIARLMTQFGMYSQTTPRNDASTARGQWQLADAYRYVSEAFAGYHLDVQHGMNVEAGLFMSYIGLWSYYQADNWTYQPSYVSSNTPWFFDGMRVQWFPTDTLKIEPWVVNGWQSYGRFAAGPGVGGQILWRPRGWISILGNQYAGADTLGVPGRRRFHTDDSVMFKWLDSPKTFLDREAASLTVDAGCEQGGGVTCRSQRFLGFMAYDRTWLAHDAVAMTVGGGVIDNPGRYLVLLPPINGATAASGTPYFSESPGDRFRAWDTQETVDWMPDDFVTFRLEYNHRFADVPYFAGRGGLTPPGGNQGAPGSAVPGWGPDLVKTENRITLALLLKM